MSNRISSLEEEQKYRQQLEHGKKYVLNTFEQFAKEAEVSIEHEWGKCTRGNECSLAVYINGKRFVAKFNYEDLMDACDASVQAKLEKIIKGYFKSFVAQK
jgi:hypothetical protein